MSKHWYCKLEGKEQGPYSASELKALVSEGRLRPEDPIRRGDQKNWTTARHVKGLFPEDAGHQTVPPPLPKNFPDVPAEGSLPSLSPENESPQDPAADEAVLPVIQVDSPLSFPLSSESDLNTPFSRRRQPQKKMQILALALLGGVVVLGILLFLVFTGVLGPSRSAPEKSGKPAAEEHAGSTNPDAILEGVENK